ncbi:MAG: gamma-glutamyltransferase [Flavobacteriaceae bacterium]
MRLIPFLLLLLLFSCKTEQQPTKKTGLIAENAMVVTAREEASEIGLSILKQGGNAFDAMAATELALAVAFPFAGNIGGGGFMVYRTQDGQTGTLDYREKAPLAAHSDMYLDEKGEVIPGKSILGAMAIGVPGTIAGIFAAHEKFGSLPIENIIEPVISLARKGVVVTSVQERSLNRARDLIIQTSGENTLFSKVYKAGDTIKHLAFAETLTTIKNNGRDEFYKGETAKKIVDFLKQNGSIISLEDLEKYEAKWRKPVTFNYKDLKIISMSPPSSGGVCLGQILKMIEPYDLKSYGHNSLESVQLIAEASRRAYADRSYYLGDPDFVEIPLDTLLSETYLSQRMSNFTFEQATPSSSVSHGSIKMSQESNETTHYSIVDSFGNAVSVTTTLNGAYGSKLYSEELGFFFNNEMDDFSSKPREPNMFGLIGAEANKIEPEKRMLSSMTPTIIEKDGKLWMVLGTPGGSRIITTVLQTLLNVYEFEMTMQEASDAPRFHHQWLPDEITFEDGFSNTLFEKLKTKGYTTTQNEAQILGSITAILVLEDGKLEAGADKRRDNKGLGF